jgi:hypothetical protein
MGRQAEETERRTDASIDGLEGRKTAIREKARETKSEAGELCHWEIVGEMAQKIGDQATKELAEWAVAVQRGHIEIVRRAALALAADEAEALV